MANGTTETAASDTSKYDLWQQLKLPHFERPANLVKSANKIQSDSLKPLEKLAIAITDKVGSMGFFLIIFSWTILWCGYNILASEVPGLHWKSFDPFPACVAYLLISNVIQILLMPLIMVGQNLQGRHSETRAELDFEINQQAEKEVNLILRHLEHNTELIIELMKHLDCKISEEVVRAIDTEHKLADHLDAIDPAKKLPEA